MLFYTLKKFYIDPFLYKQYKRENIKLINLIWIIF